LKVKYGDDVITDGYLKLEDAPFSELYKESMNKILANANGRPVVIQPLFQTEGDKSFIAFCCRSPYFYLEDYLKYLDSIGYIVPVYDVNSIGKIGVSNLDLIPVLAPVDFAHYSPFWLYKLIEPTVERIKEILDNNFINDKNIDLSNTASLIRTSPRTLRVDESNFIQFESSKDPKKLYVTKYEKDKMIVETGEFLDDVFCAGVNRPHVRIYFNLLKHKEDLINFNLLSSESQIVVAGIYYDANRVEGFTKLEVLKPLDSKTFLPEEKILGLIVGAPSSGCSEEKPWVIPSFLAQISFG
jgi:hypothetical protein